MQAITLTPEGDPYNAAMQTGRPAKHPRPPFGARVHALREAAGLSQAQLAAKLGLAQRSYSQWERRPVALRHDQLEALAGALGVTMAELVGAPGTKQRGSGPTGRAKRTFEVVSKLPRSQQQKILDVVEALVKAS